MELAALLDDVLGVAGKPGRHPLGALEERQRRLAGAANRPAPNETARVDEAHVLEDPARCHDAGRHRGQRGHARQALGDGAQAEGVNAAVLSWR